MPELGKKFECAECGTKFYDLGKADPTCPKCGTSARETGEKRPAPEPRARYVAPAAPAEVEEDLADDIVDDDEEILTVEGAEDEEEEEEDDDDEV